MVVGRTRPSRPRRCHAPHGLLFPVLGGNPLRRRTGRLAIVEQTVETLFANRRCVDRGGRLCLCCDLLDLQRLALVLELPILLRELCYSVTELRRTILTTASIFAPPTCARSRCRRCWSAASCCKTLQDVPRWSVAVAVTVRELPLVLLQLTNALAKLLAGVVQLGSQEPNVPFEACNGNIGAGKLRDSLVLPCTRVAELHQLILKLPNDL